MPQQMRQLLQQRPRRPLSLWLQLMDMTLTLTLRQQMGLLRQRQPWSQTRGNRTAMSAWSMPGMPMRSPGRCKDRCERSALGL